MSFPVAAGSAERCAGPAGAPAQARPALIAAVLGFFVITLDAVVVNVALPSIRADLGGSVAGLQWVIDAYTVLFAALLLTAGSLTDRTGARRTFGAGLAGFVLASVACGLSPTLAALVAARFVQGSAAAVMTPSSMAMIRQAFPEPVTRGRALAMWAMGGAVASSSGPVLGGVLDAIDWRWIFFVNVPVGALALLLLTRVSRSSRRPAPVDAVGQVTGVLAMGGLTYGAIEAGTAGLTAPRVLGAFAIAVAALTLFVVTERRVAHPMTPPGLFRSPTVVIIVATGFAFMVCYFGLPFVFSLWFQEVRGLSALATGVAFLPMMLIGAALTPFSARLAERFGHKVLIVAGLLSMTAGSIVLSLLPASTPLWALSALMMLVGLGGPLVSPPAATVLLDAVTARDTGTASGVFNTSRQVGGALAVAVFGALLADPATFQQGVRTSLLLAAAVAATTAIAALRLRIVRTTLTDT
ncbi:MFS transporter [Amycolatopsis balhimycina DSM 5908]|uniref:MFS transporter n=1 Tax=Amycolatopsis balhimycina DSM 5908 TaxID=1081091 RepID=A0A428WMA0_AMYBA|nr:MFS transporter [Amycolatopsis balhimycina]RSM44214.1 MFS transporter [Amycolatopsis balhimycina DSM 5908]